jgi:hypothetical protein
MKHMAAGEFPLGGPLFLSREGECRPLPRAGAEISAKVLLESSIVITNSLIIQASDQPFSLARFGNQGSCLTACLRLDEDAGNVFRAANDPVADRREQFGIRHGSRGDYGVQALRAVETTGTPALTKSIRAPPAKSYSTSASAKCDSAFDIVASRAEGSANDQPNDFGVVK